MTTSISAEFVDTNVIAYAFDVAERRKHEIARALVDRLVDAQAGVASIQVLQELYVTLTRQSRSGLDPDIARSMVAEVAANLRIVEPNVADVLNAMDAASRWQISLWDAMLVTTADRAGANVLWTEDLNHGQLYGHVTARNPFLPA